MTTPDRVVGKQIVYATKNCVAPNVNAIAFDVDSLADIPKPESHIAAGWPICTLFAEATNSETCRQRLEEAARRFRMVLQSEPSAQGALDLAVGDKRFGGMAN